MKLRDVDTEAKREIILEAVKVAGLGEAVEEIIRDGLLDLSPEPEKKEERVAPTSVKAGDMYIANCNFENIGATIYDKDVLVVITTGYNFEIGVATSIKDAKAGAYIDRWTLEENALVSNCTKYVKPGKVTKVATPGKKEPAFRRMNQEQFRVALSEH